MINFSAQRLDINQGTMYRKADATLTKALGGPRCLSAQPQLQSLLPWSVY